MTVSILETELTLPVRVEFEYEVGEPETGSQEWLGVFRVDIDPGIKWDLARKAVWEEIRARQAESYGR